MSVELNHIIIPAHDKLASAQLLASILGLSAGPQVGPFIPVQLGNGVTLDYADATDFHSHHCAFLVDDEVFDAALARVRDAGITIYADPHHQQPGELNHRLGGRGFYFDDPNGHNMELMTRVTAASPVG
jgi:catechol 2,3-dioxygenase-like lactoylglutathione lyase family enzyme